MCSIVNLYYSLYVEQNTQFAFTTLFFTVNFNIIVHNLLDSRIIFVIGIL